MRTLTILIPNEGESGGFDVVDSDGRLADGLCFDELIGQLISLAHPKLGTPRYAMKTPEEWAEERRRMEERVIAHVAQELDKPKVATQDDLEALLGKGVAVETVKPMQAEIPAA